MLSLATFLFAVSAADSHSHFLDALAPSEESLGFVSESLEVEEKRSLLKTSTVKIISISIAVGTVLLSLGGGIGLGYIFFSGGGAAAADLTNKYVLNTYKAGASKLFLFFTTSTVTAASQNIMIVSKWPQTARPACFKADTARTSVGSTWTLEISKENVYHAVFADIPAGDFTCELTVTTTAVAADTGITIYTKLDTATKTTAAADLDANKETIPVTLLGPAIVA